MSALYLYNVNKLVDATVCHYHSYPHAANIHAGEIEVWSLYPYSTRVPLVPAHEQAL